MDDPLERATALLRAEFIHACESIDLALSRNDEAVLLHIKFALRIDGVVRETTRVVDEGETSTEGTRKAAIHQALSDLRLGVELAISAKGPLAGLGPVVLSLPAPVAPPEGHHPTDDPPYHYFNEHPQPDLPGSADASPRS